MSSIRRPCGCGNGCKRDRGGAAALSTLEYCRLFGEGPSEQQADSAGAGSKFDAVERPEHYASGEIECIDAIRAALGPEQFKGFCRGNAMKYLWRYERKGGAEDLRKSQFYLARLIQNVA